MTKKRSAKLDKKAITKRILTLKLHGYGGACGSAAWLSWSTRYGGNGHARGSQPSRTGVQ